MTDPPPLTGRVTPEDEISLWDVLLVLLRRRRLILGSAVVAVVLTVLVTLFAARTWTTEASFRPQGSSSGSELAALASQFGRGSAEDETDDDYDDDLTEASHQSGFTPAPTADSGETPTAVLVAVGLALSVVIFALFGGIVFLTLAQLSGG